MKIDNILDTDDIGHQVFHDRDIVEQGVDAIVRRLAPSCSVKRSLGYA